MTEFFGDYAWASLNYADDGFGNLKWISASAFLNGYYADAYTTECEWH